MVLYHATYKSRLNSIRKTGLGASKIKNWSFSLPGHTYFSPDMDEAGSLCENAEEVPESVMESGIVILCIPSEILPADRIAIDANYRSDIHEGGCVNPAYTFKGIIPSHLLSIVAVEKVNGRQTYYPVPLNNIGKHTIYMY